MRKEENPIVVGKTAIWRGWRGWFRLVTEIGEVFESETALLVPVKYTSGEYAVISVTTSLKRNGIEQLVCRELRPGNDTCYEAIRTSHDMPVVISVSPDSYKLGVTGEFSDDIVFVRRGRASLVNEQVCIAPR